MDLAAVRADDALLDAVAGGARLGGATDVLSRQDDEHLAAVLAAWRADIEAEPMPGLVSLDEAADAVEAGHAARVRHTGRARRRMPFAVAAAAIAVALSGFTVAVHSAQPGDAMFGLTKVFFAEHAGDAEKTQRARDIIVAANQAISRNDMATARSLLQSVEGKIADVPADDQPALQQQRAQALQSIDPRPTDASPSGDAPGGTTADGGAGAVTPAPAKPSDTVAASPTTTTTPADSTAAGTTADDPARTTTTVPDAPAGNN